MATEIVDHAREYDGFGSDERADEVTLAVLETLAERLSAGEAEDLAELLPEKYADELLTPAPRHPQEYALAEFLDRVERRADLDYDEREAKTAAVMTALDDVVHGEEVSRAREQLPDEYDRLFEAEA